MFGSDTPKRRYRRLLVPLLAGIVAASVVAAVSLATQSSSSPPTARTSAGGASAAVAFQGAFVRVVQSVSPSVVQIEDQTGLGSGIVLDGRGRHRHEQPRRQRRALVHRDDVERQAVPGQARRARSRPTTSR